MSKSDAPDGVVIEREGASATTVALHALVLINISDHFTRQNMLNDDVPRVVGVIVGTQQGRHVEIFDSFALPALTDDGLDMKFLRAKMEQFQKVFPTFDILGWYSTGGDEPTQGDLALQAQMASANENPLYLLLNVDRAVPSTVGLPITLYEPEIKVVDKEPKVFFAPMQYRIETGESERVSVDHIAHLVVNAEDDSCMTHSLGGIENAIKRLAERIEVIQSFVQDVVSGKTAKDHSVLRQVASLCNQLPAIDSERFKDEFLREYNDTLLVTYLASVTKGNNLVSGLVEKFNIAYERHSRRRGFFG